MWKILKGYFYRFIIMKEKIVKTKKIESTRKEKIKKDEVVEEKIEEKLADTNEVLKISEAIKRLRSYEKRKFDQTVDLIINLQKFDSRKESLNSVVSVPHVYERKIAAFLATKVNGVDVILKDNFDNYKNLRDAKRLAKKYDLFISSAPLMGQVATRFGRALGPPGKMPSPQLGLVLKEDEETINKLVEKMKKSVRVRTKEKVVKVGIGKESMDDEALIENITFAIKGIIELLPLKKDNVKNILIKFTMTPAIKVIYEN